MTNEILVNIILLGKLHKHECSRTINSIVELYSPINRIIIKMIDEKEIQVKYNLDDETKVIELPIFKVYDFVEKLIIRTARIEITPKTGELIEICNFNERFQQSILEIQSEKNYNHYLKHLKFDIDMKFEVEYFDDIIILRDKQNILLTNIFKLNDAAKNYNFY
jgi:hypothetical protein